MDVRIDGEESETRESVSRISLVVSGFSLVNTLSHDQKSSDSSPPIRTSIKYTICFVWNTYWNIRWRFKTNIAHIFIKIEVLNVENFPSLVYLHKVHDTCFRSWARGLFSCWSLWKFDICLIPICRIKAINTTNGVICITNGHL